MPVSTHFFQSESAYEYATNTQNHSNFSNSEKTNDFSIAEMPLDKITPYISEYKFYFVGSRCELLQVVNCHSGHSNHLGTVL